MFYHCVRDRQALADLKPEWAALLARAPSSALPLTHEWALAWWDSFGDGAEMAVGCVWHGEVLVALAPLMRKPVELKGIAVAGAQLMNNGYSPHGDVLICGQLGVAESARALRLIIEHAFDEQPCEIISLQKLPPQSRVMQAELHQALGGFSVGVQDNVATPMIPIDGAWPDYFQGLSASFRKGVRRRLKAVDRMPEFRVEQRLLTGADDPAIDIMVGVSARSWKASDGTDLGNDANGLKFLRGVIAAFAPVGDVQLWFAWRGDQAIAYELLIGHDRIVYPIRADFDRNHADLSPGTVLMYRVLEALFACGKYRTYDCCAADYEYLRHWTRTRRQYRDVQIFAASIKPQLLHLLAYRAAPAVRRLKQIAAGISRNAHDTGGKL